MQRPLPRAGSSAARPRRVHATRAPQPRGRIGGPAQPNPAKSSSGSGHAGSAPSVRQFRSSPYSLAEHARDAKPWYVIMPDNLFIRWVWRPLQAVLLMWAAIVVPILVSFDPLRLLHPGGRGRDGIGAVGSASARLNVSQQSLFHNLVLAMDVLFMLDLLMHFVIAVYDEENQHYIVSSRSIALRYLRGWFCVDFVAAFPFDLVIEAAAGRGDGGAQTMVRLTRLLRLARVLRLVRLIKVARMNEMLEGLRTNFG